MCRGTRTATKTKVDLRRSCGWNLWNLNQVDFKQWWNCSQRWNLNQVDFKQWWNCSQRCSREGVVVGDGNWVRHGVATGDATVDR
jgi:hypothetical protein